MSHEDLVQETKVFCARVPSGVRRELTASGNRQHRHINVSAGGANSLQFLRGVKKKMGLDGVFIAVGNEEPITAKLDGDTRVLGLSFTTRDVEKVSGPDSNQINCRQDFVWCEPGRIQCDSRGLQLPAKAATMPVPVNGL